MALTYGEISSITQDLFIPKLVDAIFGSNSLLARAKKKWTRLVDGGTQINVPLLYATTTAVGRFSGSDSLSTSSNDQISMATFDWCQYYANITITRLDELKNSGKSQVVSFVKAKVQAAEKSLANLLGTDIFADGSTTNAVDGLALIGAVTGTYGGIAKGSYSWWQAKQDTSTTAFSLPAFQALMGDCTVDNDKPTVAVTTQDIFDDAWASMTPMQRFTEKDTADAGFTNLLINGIPLLVDSHQTASYMHLINEKYIELVIHKDENFRFEPFIKPVNQAVSCAKVFLATALTCSNCRMQGQFSALV
jgi:hypothetical protein